MSKCALDCGRTLPTGAKLKTCAICRGSMGFMANHRTTAWMVQRADRLALYQRRVGNVRKGKSGRTW